MTTKTYGQYCGVARAMELVGERWALLIIRDLLVGPKRYTDLRAGLPKIPTNVLATRLKELEQGGVVARRVEPSPSRAIVYELTPYGADLDQVVLALGRWGARSLGELRPGEIVTTDILVMALRSTFRPDRAKKVRARVSYELRFGDLIVHALVDDESLEVAAGPIDKPNVVIEARGPLSPLLNGELDGEAALKAGLVTTDGTPADLNRFAQFFPI
jgi:DNA-binding HxlR family transcriptional regulator